MTGNVSIDLSLTNIWKSWQKFRRGKKLSPEIEYYSYNLEQNLLELYADLNSGKYQHSDYRKFFVTDNKRREISVARIKDRIVHRLVYEYLLPIDKTFDFDAWSCRKGKGLLAAITRAQDMTKRYKNCYVWRADIKKFFDNVDQNKMMCLIRKRISDPKALWLCEKIIESYVQKNGDLTASQIERERERESNSCLRQESLFQVRRGMPIGNLTSQIFANIYLNELDRWVRISYKTRAYLRYGDDFLIFSQKLEKLEMIREDVIKFLEKELSLEVNIKNDKIVKVRQGIKYLGVMIYPSGRKLTKRNVVRINRRSSIRNSASYRSLLEKHQKQSLRTFNWQIMEKISDE